MARSAVTGADNREVKADRDVTWGCESLGGPECRELLAEQQPYEPEGCSVRSRGKEAVGKTLARGTRTAYEASVWWARGLRNPKPEGTPDRAGVDAACMWSEGHASYPGRSRLTSERMTQEALCSEKSATAIVCAWQRTCQEGSSPSGSLVGRSISKRGGNASRARGVILRRPLNGHAVGNDGHSQGDGPKGLLQPKGDLDGRVSVARRNLKGMRRSSGP